MENIKELIYLYLSKALDDFKNNELTQGEERLFTELYAELLFSRTLSDDISSRRRETDDDFMKWMSLGWFIDKILSPHPIL